MKLNKILMEGFVPPILDGNRQPAKMQSFKDRQKRQQLSRHIGRYEDARVVRSYAQAQIASSQADKTKTATGDNSKTYENYAQHKRKRNYQNRPTSFDIVRPSTRQNQSSMSPSQTTPAPTSRSGYHFTEPKSRPHP